MLVPAAQARLDGSLRDSDALDTKALGILAIDLGAVALLVAVHRTINPLWWIPGITLVVAGLLLGATIWPREFYFGPDIAEFYTLMADATPLQASRQMLTELLVATDRNGKRGKMRCFRWGLVILVVGLIGCLPVALIRPG